MKHLFAALALAACTFTAHAAQPLAGTVAMQSGKLFAARGSHIVPLAKSSALYAADHLTTAAQSYANLQFNDGGRFLMRPETRFVITQHQVSPATQSAAAKQLPVAVQKDEAVQYRLIKGGFRTVSGLVGKNGGSYEVNTPVASLGIRGTIYAARLCSIECEDRSELSTLMRDMGYALGEGELLLIVDVLEGTVWLKSVKAASDLPANSTWLVREDGSLYRLQKRPRLEEQEANLVPAACAVPEPEPTRQSLLP